MGRRGPKADDEFGEQTAVLSTRIRPDTREALVAAAAASGRKLSREVENRLRRSFRDDERIELLFGGPQLFAMFRLVAAAMLAGGGGGVFDRETPWLRDPDKYDQAVKAAIAVLEAMRPGPVNVKSAPRTGNFVEDALSHPGEVWGELLVQHVRELDAVEPSPMEEMGESTRRLREIAADLKDRKTNGTR